MCAWLIAHVQPNRQFQACVHMSPIMQHHFQVHEIECDIHYAIAFQETKPFTLFSLNLSHWADMKEVDKCVHVGMAYCSCAAKQAIPSLCSYEPDYATPFPTT
jgi:hypothetical protein